VRDHDGAPDDEPDVEGLEELLARDAFLAALAKAPDYSPAKLYLAQAHVQLGERQQAESLLTAVIKEMPGAIDARRLLGALRLQRGDYAGVNEVCLGTTRVPEPEADELLVQAEITSISPGTELRCLAGKQAGFPGYPCVGGYSMIGRVVRAGEATKTPVGARVFCGGSQKLAHNKSWAGHMEYAITTDAAAPANKPRTDIRFSLLGALPPRTFHGIRPG